MRLLFLLLLIGVIGIGLFLLGGAGIAIHWLISKKKDSQYESP